MKGNSGPMTGINIQWPISQLIFSGDKIIETRIYPLPDKYVGQKLVFIETPGPVGRFKSRAIGLITFGESFLYQNKSEFYADFERHLVSKASPWAWRTGKKYGWPVIKIARFDQPIEIQQRKGIIFTNNLTIKMPAHSSF